MDDPDAHARVDDPDTLARALGTVLGTEVGGLRTAVPTGGLPLAAPDPMELLRDRHAEHGEPRPALELAFRWLAGHRPPVTGRTLVHGDFRNGNLMLGPDGLVAVLDWELAHLGDPVEDLGWRCVKA